MQLRIKDFYLIYSFSQWRILFLKFITIFKIRKNSLILRNHRIHKIRILNLWFATDNVNWTVDHFLRAMTEVNVHCLLVLI